jgi:hypothetical protein
MCLIDDADPSTFSSDVVLRAKKEHVCSECRRVIHASETYTRSVVFFDGTARTYKRCSHCNLGAEWLEKHCGGWLYSEVKTELEEHYREGYREDGLQEILIGMRRKWQAFQGSGLLDLPQ